MVEVPLSQVLKHEKLFEQYPQLKDIKVSWEYSKAKGSEDEKNIYYGASYDLGENLITVGSGLNDKQIRSALLHEVQHAVQSIEDFARGTNAQSGGSFDNYIKSHGETEARLTQTRADKGYENFPYDDLDVPRNELVIRDGEGVAEMAKELEDRYIVNGKVDEQALLSDAEPFKKVAYTKENFAKQFGVDFGETAFIKTPKGVPNVYLDTNSQYYKLSPFKYKEDRRMLVGVINDIFTNPLFVVEHNGANKFFAVFNDNGKGLYAISVTEKEGIIETVKSNYRPIKNGKLDKVDFKSIQELIEVPEGNLLYFKHKGNDGKISNSYSEHIVNEDATFKYSTATKQMLDTGDAMQIPKKSPSTNKSIAKDYKDSQGFYSVLEKTIDEKVGGKMDSVSLAKMLEKNGVKADELEWSGLKELMANNDKLTKEQIEETIKANRLEIEVVPKTEKTKYEKYKLDGGENYREMLLKLPDTKKGYKSDHWDEKNILAFTRVDDRTIDNKKTLFVEEIQSDWHQEGRQKGYDKKGVPDAPFKKNWQEFALKRMVQEAVANDYDKIAWTTGRQQADRYSLEKTVDTVVYNKYAGALQGTNGKKEVFFKTVSSEKEIEELMGKELTARLLESKNANDGVHILQGEELKFGGEGMQGFYDQIVPSAAKKLFKKYGVKPKMEELDDVEQMVWSVDITPQMKEDIKKYGQPLYARGGEEILGGAVAGIEYDESGNITGIDVEKFIAGAAAGHIASKALQKEKRGIYNVTYNGKNSTQIKKYDLEALNDYIKYERGDAKKGAIHIQKHLEDGSQGSITDDELLKMGEIIRDMNYFIKDGKRVYEKYENDIRYRIVVGDGKKQERVISFFSDRKGANNAE